MSSEIVLAPRAAPVAETEPGFVSLVLVYNPLEPGDRSLAKLDWFEGKTLSEYLNGLPDEMDWAVNLDGENLSDQELWSKTFPKSGALLVVCPVPRGKMAPVLMMVAMIALAVAAPYAGAAFAGAIGMAGSTTAIAIGSALFTTIGGLLISAIMPKPDVPSLDSESDSTTYGIDGPKNTAAEGVPVPIVYGKRRVAGNLVNIYNENDIDADGLSIQRLFVQFAVSEGPVFSLSDFQINDQPLSNYNDVEVRHTLGVASQTPSDWFTETVTLHNLSRDIQMTEDTYTTVSEVEQVRLDIAAPQGLVNLSGNKRSPVSVNIRVEIKPFGASGAEWAPFAGFNSVHTVTDKSRSVVRRSLHSKPLALGRYDIRFRRETDLSTNDAILDKLVVSDIGEITNSGVGMIHTATISLKALVTGEFNATPQVSALCQGLVMPIYDAAGAIVANAWSDNPADIAIDMQTNPRYGGSENLARMDWAAYAEWREFCASNGLRCNIVFDFMGNIDDALSNVFIQGRANEVRSGSKNSITIDRSSQPVMVFNSSNMAEDTFSLSYLSFQDRVNEVEVQFYDENDGYKQRFIRATDDEAEVRGEPQKPTTVNLIGEVTAQGATDYAMFQLESNKRLIRSASWESPVEAVTCLPGDVVLVQHEMPSWAEGGRIDAGSTANVVKLDRDVAFSTSPQRRLLVVHDAIERYSVTISSQANATAFVTGMPLSAARVRRLVVPGVGDFAILAVAASGSPRQILLEPSAADVFLSGLTCGAWDTDVIEERNVTAWNPTTLQATVSPAFSAAPALHSKWLFGEVNITGKPFRISMMGMNGDSVQRISAIEYREELYGDLFNIPAPLVYATPSYIRHVRNLAVTEEVDLTGSVRRSMVAVTWDRPESSVHRGSLVMKRVNNGPWELVRDVPATVRRVEFEALVNDVVFVRVLAYDDKRVNAPESTAPMVGLTMVGWQRTPASPVGFGVVAGLLSATVSVDASAESDFKAWELFKSVTPVAPTKPTVSFVGTQHVLDGLTANQQVYFWLRAVNTSNKRSGLVGPLVVTPRALIPADFSPGMITLALLEQSIQDAISGGGFDIANAEAARDAAVAAQAAAELAATDAVAAALAADDAVTTSTAAAGTASTKAVQASDSASNASTAAATAVTARDAAQASAAASASSATSASTSATQASTQAAAATSAKTLAESARTQAQTSATASATSATAAGTSATNAGASATASQSSRIAAESAANAASGSASVASGAAATATAKAAEAGTLAETAARIGPGANLIRTGVASALIGPTGTPIPGWVGATMSASGGTFNGKYIQVLNGARETTPLPGNPNGRTYRIRGRVWNGYAGGTSSLIIRLVDAYTFAAISPSAVLIPAGTGWTDVDVTTTGYTDAEAFLIRIFCSASPAYAGVQSLVVEDITSAVDEAAAAVQVETTARVTETEQLARFLVRTTLLSGDRRVITGFGFQSSVAEGGTPESEFEILADKFKVVAPATIAGQPSKTMFSVQNVDGVAQVAINGLLFADNIISRRTLLTAAVNEDKIEAGAVTNNLIVSSNADILRTNDIAEGSAISPTGVFGPWITMQTYSVPAGVAIGRVIHRLKGVSGGNTSNAVEFRLLLQNTVVTSGSLVTGVLNPTGPNVDSGWLVTGSSSFSGNVNISVQLRFKRGSSTYTAGIDYLSLNFATWRR